MDDYEKIDENPSVNDSSESWVGVGGIHSQIPKKNFPGIIGISCVPRELSNG